MSRVVGDKIKIADIPIILRLLKTHTQKEVAKAFGVTQGAISYTIHERERHEKHQS